MSRNTYATLLELCSRIANRLLVLGLWCCGIGAVLGLAMRYWPGDRLLPIRLMNYLMPWFLLVLVPALLIAALMRRGWLAAVLATPVLLISMNHPSLFLPRARDTRYGSSIIKIMSYNVQRRNGNVDGVSELILREKPDIVLLQELNRSRVDSLVDSLELLYPDSDSNFAYEEGLRQAVFCRYEILSSQALPDKGRAQKLSIDIASTPLTVFNIHPYRRLGWHRRYNQMSKLMSEDIEGGKTPVILGGDFNTTEHSETGRIVNKSLRNAHREVGRGFGFTYPYSARLFGRHFHAFPVVRIDHIYFSEHFIPISARTLDETGGSDHYPVVAELRLESGDRRLGAPE
jgi:endonuclease/exonuclease/phosphatase (EEP) superfamily protein YafD